MTKQGLFFLSSLFCLLSSVLPGCGKPLYKEAEMIMGTFVEVISDDPRAKSIVFGEFKRLDKIFSLFDKDSELYRLNKNSQAQVSPELFDVIKKSIDFHAMTDGAFDVTVAPVSLLWKKAIQESHLPDEGILKKALGFVGIDKVTLDEAQRVVKLRPGTMIDLGGIAKGYAVDRAVEGLKKAGIASAVVNAGGNMFCLGKNGPRAWGVGIQDPRWARHLKGKLELSDRAVSTSGDYEQFFVKDGRRYSHIVDPATGFPTDTGLVSATVTAPDATTADVISTALIVLGREKGKNILVRFPAAAAAVIDTQGRMYEL